MSDNLDLEQWASSQDQPDLTVNTSLVQLSGALADFFAVDMSGGDVSVSTANFQAYMGFVTSGASTAHTLTIPAVKRALFYVENNNTAALTVTVGTTSLVVDEGVIGFFQTDGTANGLIAIVPGSASGSVEQDIVVVFSGLPPAGNLSTSAAWVVLNQAIDLPISLTGSNFAIGTNPTSTMTFSLYKNGSSIGTVAFSTGGSPTVSFTGLIDFAIGDIFQVVPPGSQDATGANVSLNFKATKT